MTKSEVIESVAYVNLPEGTKLVEHSTPGGFTFAHFNHTNAHGLKLMAARIFADQLTADTADLPEIPNARLLECLHGATLDFHLLQIRDCLFEAVEEDIRADHRKMVEKIRQVALELGIVYRELEDSLLA